MKETNVGLNNQNEAIVDIKEVIEPVDDQEYLNHIETSKSQDNCQFDVGFKLLL